MSAEDRVRARSVHERSVAQGLEGGGHHVVAAPGRVPASGPRDGRGRSGRWWASRLLPGPRLPAARSGGALPRVTPPPPRPGRGRRAGGESESVCRPFHSHPRGRGRPARRPRADASPRAGCAGLRRWRGSRTLFHGDAEHEEVLIGQEGVLGRELEARALRWRTRASRAMRISRGGPRGVASFLKSMITTWPAGRSILFMRVRYFTWSSSWCQVSQTKKRSTEPSGSKGSSTSASTLRTLSMPASAGGGSGAGPFPGPRPPRRLGPPPLRLGPGEQ